MSSTDTRIKTHCDAVAAREIAGWLAQAEQLILQAQEGINSVGLPYSPDLGLPVLDAVTAVRTATNQADAWAKQFESKVKEVRS